MKKSTKKFTGSIATLATVASIIAPSAAVLAAEKSVDEYVSYAEKTANFYDFNVAFGKVLALPKAEQGSYLARLAAVEGKAKTADVQAVLTAIMEFGSNRDLTNFYKVYDLVNKVTEEKNRLYLQGELNTWGHDSVFTADVVAATDAILKAWGAKTVENVKAAEVKVAALKLAGNVSWCNEQLAQVKAQIAPYVESVSAVDSTTVKVALSTPVKDVDFTNFAVNNSRTVVKATLSADKKSVDVKVNQPFVRNQEYTVTASGLTNLKGDVAADLKGKFVWAVQDGITVALKKSTLSLGEATTYTIKDQDGKTVTPLSVTIATSNSHVVSTNGTSTITAVAEGTADITLTVTLADNSILTNTFKVTAADVADQVANQGFTLVSSLATAPSNTVAFNAGSKTTWMYANATKTVAMYDLVNGDPQAAAYDFTNCTVRSLNPIVATASIDASGVLSVTTNAKQSGTASFEVTLADSTKRTFSVEVRKEAALTSFDLDTTSVKLSDEEVNSVANRVEGVNAKTVTVTLVDQYDLAIAKPATFGKVTVTSNTDGLTLVGMDANNVLAIDTDGEVSFGIQAQKDKIVNGTVSVKYFKDAADAQPTVTKTIAVNVVNVSATATHTSLDVVAASQIDVNAPYTASASDVNHIDFANADIFVLDANGNRLEKVAANSVAVSDDDHVSLSAKDVVFNANELTLLTKSGSVNVDVTADGITKRLPISYINSASVPASATVNASPVAVKLDSADTSLTFEELIFGALDSTQLVQDTTGMSDYIAVSSGASNGGYVYNKPLLSFKNASGNVLATGASVYGVNLGTISGNTWVDDAKVSTARYLDDNFAVDFSVANLTTTGAATVTAPGTLAGTINVATGETVTFTLVISGVRVQGAPTTNNLLAAPVTVNVTVAK